MSRIHEMVDATASKRRSERINRSQNNVRWTAIRPATKSVELLDALVEKPRPQGFSP